MPEIKEVWTGGKIHVAQIILDKIDQVSEKQKPPSFRIGGFFRDSLFYDFELEIVSNRSLTKDVATAVKTEVTISSSRDNCIDSCFTPFETST